jgi:hypothetical protein
MTGIPNSTLIALWVVGSCWTVSLIGYLFDEPADLVFPLVTFGALTGIAEWVVRSREH